MSRINSSRRNVFRRRPTLPSRDPQRGVREGGGDHSLVGRAKKGGYLLHFRVACHRPRRAMTKTRRAHGCGEQSHL